jgi:hypothetical protein
VLEGAVRSFGPHEKAELWEGSERLLRMREQLLPVAEVMFSERTTEFGSNATSGVAGVATDAKVLERGHAASKRLRGEVRDGGAAEIGRGGMKEVPVASK